MIIDRLDNLQQYESLNPLIAKVVEKLQNLDLMALPLGRNELVDVADGIPGDDLFMNVQQTEPKSEAEVRLETHRRMVDIQIPLDGPEGYGYTPTRELPEIPYDEEGDYSLYEVSVRPQTFFTVHPGQFAIFFPEDGHAPQVSATGVKKIVVKLKNN